MSGLEVAIVGTVVSVAALLLLRRVAAASKGEKGSCKSCGDVCGCAIKDQIKSRRP